MNLNENPHRRYNPLSGEWVKVSPHRTKRPWDGQVEDPVIDDLPAHDSGCYLCPGNTRAGGHKNPDYKETFIFDNDFAALLPEQLKGDTEVNKAGGLVRASADRGLCRVLCFSPRHDLTLARMSCEEIQTVVKMWTDQYEEIGSKDFINHVQIFENRGAMMGCSNPHPHGQIWAEEAIPDLPAREINNQKAYFVKKGSQMLSDYLTFELGEKERIVYQNDHFAVLVPFWALWPFETMILPKRNISSLSEMTDHECASLAEAIRILGIKYDNLFSTSFPYSMGIHQAPTDGEEHPELTLHFHYFPPLLRSATVKKFMVGYELMAMAQRDITSELSAARLRELPEVHFRDRLK
ncbi:MAG: UDP-glucose--hexose-1-phosphate uridylyltransferase [Spirochaetales bacterium]|nr:UDP-glucose--hexose-1-phosphate uridylyltransferase [Spirochaetales bacterium]